MDGAATAHRGGCLLAGESSSGAREAAAKSGPIGVCTHTSTPANRVCGVLGVQLILFIECVVC